mgnify:CR=1 FL=1
MKPIEVIDIPANSGRAFEVKTDQFVKITAQSIVDFVAFCLPDLKERFDQARTKANQGKIFISTGDFLFSKLNNAMFRFEEDGFTKGTHDLQYGMCSLARWKRALEDSVAEQTYLKSEPLRLSDFPDHGCFENLISALEPWDIAQEDIPSPLNLFQHMNIDGKTGKMEHTRVRPEGSESPVTLRALRECLVGVSACPDLLVGGKPVRVEIMDSDGGVF